MQFLFKSNGNDAPLEGWDWIVLSANALGVAIVTAATLHANAPDQTANFASVDTPAQITLASLD